MNYTNYLCVSYVVVCGLQIFESDARHDRNDVHDVRATERIGDGTTKQPQRTAQRKNQKQNESRNCFIFQICFKPSRRAALLHCQRERHTHGQGERERGYVSARCCERAQLQRHRQQQQGNNKTPAGAHTLSQHTRTHAVVIPVLHSLYVSW